MASTIKLSATTNWAQSFCRLQPLTGQGGVVGEPALTNANGVLQFILGPPFAWPWNRATNSTIVTTPGVQDYTIALPTFGWLEKASVYDGTTKWSADCRLVLPDATDPGRPLEIAPQLDDDEGNITFRCYPVPDEAYTLFLVFQKRPVLMVNQSSLWSPIPDDKAYLYNSGFLAAAFENLDDQRFQVEYPKFLRSTIAANSGLTEAQVNMFLSERLITSRQAQGVQLDTQQGKSSRG